MIYLPKHFEVTDEAKLREFVSNNPFGTLVTFRDGRPEFSRLPFQWEETGVVGHVAASNPHSQAIRDGADATILVDGPHCYVSSRWYSTPTAIPTWNYASVLLEGQLEVIEGGEAVDALKRLVGAFDDTNLEPFAGVWDDPAFWSRASAIVAFRLRVKSATGKFKLSQNKSAEDRAAVCGVLSASDRPDDRAVAALMQQL